MKKHLLIGGAMALCLMGVMFVAQADEVVRYDHNGNPYIRKGHGPVAGSFAKVFTGSNREYLPREEGRRDEDEGRDRRDYRGYRR